MNTCSITGKARYPDAGAAHEALRGLKARKDLRDAGDLEPFWCTGCGGVHLGHKPRRERRKQRGRRRVADRRRS